MSEQAKRFFMDWAEGESPHMEEDAAGDYVLASDYDALAQRCRELEAKCERTERARAGWEENATLLEQERDTLALRCRELDNLSDQWAESNARLHAEVERLKSQVATLQSDANSWQSGYDKGRRDGDRFARKEES
ncbi:MAG TPA: hypothetical protein VIZ86_16420 [Pseudomonas sp.]